MLDTVWAGTDCVCKVGVACSKCASIHLVGFRTQVVGVVTARAHAGVCVDVQSECADTHECKHVSTNTDNMEGGNVPAARGDGGRGETLEGASVFFSPWLAMQCTAKSVFCFIVF